MKQPNSKFKVADVLVEPSSNRLSHNDQQVLIEGRLMALLVYLCRHAGSTVSQDELIKHVWQGNVVSSSAIYRAMAELRKALEMHFGLKNTIKTIPKKGYLIEPSLITKLEFEKSNNKYHFFDKLKFTGLVLLLLLAGFFLFKFNSPEQPSEATTSLRAKTLTSLSGAEFGPALSPNGNWLLFSHRQKIKGNSQLYLLKLDNAETNEAVIGQFENNFPLDSVLLTKEDATSSYSRVSWSTSGNQIAFQRVTNNTCEISIADINLTKYQIEKIRKISNCTGSVSSAISWTKDDNNLFYISALSGRMESVKYHLKSNQANVIMSPKKPFSWNNFVVSSPFDSKVLILSFINYRETQFILYDYRDQSHKVIHSEPHVIRSASWGKNSQQIIYEVNSQRLLLLDLVSNKVKVWYEPGIYLHGITRSKQQPVYAVGQMQQAEEAIKIVQLESQEDISQAWNVNSPLIEKQPEFANLSNRLAFVSNRSGNDQIWLRQENGSLKRITDFEDEKWFGRLRWSNDDSKILFARGEVIYWVEAETGKLKTLVKYPPEESKVPYAPNWSSDSSSIFFSLHQKGKNSIWQLGLDTDNKINQISTGNNRNLQQSLDGQSLYFTTIGIPGLTQFELASREYRQLLPQLHPISWNSWRVTKKGIFYLDINQKPSAVYFYDFDSKKSHKVFEWEVVGGSQFSISFDEKLYARDLFVDSEASIVRLIKE